MKTFSSTGLYDVSCKKKLPDGGERMAKPSKSEIVSYLKNHSRYFTMNSWNRATSYALNVKIYRWVPKDLLDRAYEMLEVREPFWDIENEFNSFGERYDWRYQMWWNGKSGGYIVLGQGGRKEATYKTICDRCGKLTWYEEEQKCHVSGCEGRLKKLIEPVYQIYSQPGLGMDMGEDFNDWDYQSLKERYDLVKDFDRTVDGCKDIFLFYCKNYRVVEKTRMVSQKYKTIERVEVSV